MKKFLAIFFISVFIFQILPIKQIGKILWNGQMTEEVHEGGNCNKKMANADHDKFWYLNLSSFVSNDVTVEASYKHSHRDEALTVSVHLDVPLQPPNVA